MTLNVVERERHARQLELEGWDEAAQERLRTATALVVGAGSVGSAAAPWLACAGVARIGVVDRSWVSVRDLGSQPLHFTPDAQSQKAESAAQKLGVLNTAVTAEPYPVELDELNAEALVTGASVVLACGGDARTRLLVNDACCAQRVPLVVATASGYRGLVQAVVPGAGACHRCAFPDGAGDDGAGLLGAAAGVVGSLQALLALRLVGGVGEVRAGEVIRFDGRSLQQSSVPAERRPECSACAGIGASPESG